MTSRERLSATLNHQTADRLCVDFGAGFQTGMGAGAVHRLRQSLLGKSDLVKVIESYQMLGEIDEKLRRALGLDVVGVHGPGTMFGFKNENWKPFTMFDGTPVLVPGEFNVTPADDGGWLIVQEWYMATVTNRDYVMNVQSNVPTENILAMFRAVKASLR